MPLSENQRVVHLFVNFSEYPQIDKHIRKALDIYPNCKIVAMDSHSTVSSSHFFITIETVKK
jgi:hypothetical protein